MNEPPERRIGFLGTRDTRVVIVALFVALSLLVAAGYVVGQGLLGLSGSAGESSPRGVVSDALVTAAVSGVLAAAVTEFLKRLLRLRERYNRNAVKALLGDLATFDWAVRSNGIWVTPTPPTYGAPLSQLCAQLGQSLTLLATATANSEGSRTKTWRGGASMDLPDSALQFFLGSKEEAERFQISQDRFRIREEARHNRARETAATDDDWPAAVGRGSREKASERLLARRTAVASLLAQQGERRLDAFQLRMQGRWRLMLQWISAGSAAAVMASVGLAVDAGIASVAIGCLLGLVVGGPVSWATRDLVRLVERRAE
jgi:hypothetical protein